jgi:osmoprotectant transport system permease protein
MPKPERSASRVGVLGALIGACGLLLGDFVLNRPNRLAPGDPLSLLEALGWWPVGLFSAGFAILLLVSLFPGRRGVVWGAVLPVLMFLGLLWAQGYAASELTRIGGGFTRVSVGSSLWISILGLFLIYTDMISRTGRAAPLKAGLGLILVAGLFILFFSGVLDQISLMLEFEARRSRFFSEFKAHLFITGVSVGLASVAGVPLGVALFRNRRLRGAVFSALNIVQTIPSLALFGLLIAPLAFLSERIPLLKTLDISGIGWAPAVIALTLYSFLPIVRNTFSGFLTVDGSALEAGRGMGMGRTQIFFRVELPIAAPVILNGLRIAGVQNIGNTAVAALIGAGGFGVFIFQGLGQAATDMVFLGALPTIFLAVFVDRIFQALIQILTPAEQGNDST